MFKLMLLELVNHNRRRASQEEAQSPQPTLVLLGVLSFQYPRIQFSFSWKEYEWLRALLFVLFFPNGSKKANLDLRP